MRVYVDRDASETWNEGDVPLPNITVFLDEKSTAISDQEGLARFEAVSQRRHTLALSDQDVEEMASHSLVCESTSQTVRVNVETTIQFYFSAKGFLEVDVKEDQQGE